MAGCRAPRARYANASTAEESDSGEPFGDEARAFTELRLLQRNVKVELIALPPTPINSSSASGPTFFIGHVIHPAGSIAQLLVGNGLARCVDQHAALLGAEGMAGLRSAEKAAKYGRKGIWSTIPLPGPVGRASNGQAAAAQAVDSTVTPQGNPKSFEGTVSRVWNPESVSIREGKHGEGKEIKVFFASVRGPR